MSSSPHDPIRQALDIRPGALTLVHQIRQLRRLIRLALERGDMVAADNLEELMALAKHRLGLMGDDLEQTN
jgi:hypothetical protein